MKSYGTKTEFIIGLLGVIIHTFIVSFIVAYLINPDMLDVMIDSTSGNEQELLIQFKEEVSQIGIVIYAGCAIIVFEWLAIFKNLKYTNKMTPIWGLYLILGSLYSYFYFGGLEPFILLFISGSITLIKHYRFQKTLAK